jgi:hypothetical protein
MTTPTVQTVKRSGSRFYVHPTTNAKVPGVTSITGNLPKPFLQYWGQKLVAEEAVDNLGSITQLMVAGNRDAAIDMLKRAPQRSTGNAAQTGTEVHGLAERLNRGEDLGQVHPDFEPWINQYRNFLEDWQPEFLEVESTVWSDTYGYAGTLDGICRIDGDLLLWDLKTGKGVYPEVGLQLSAYAHADYILAPDGDQREIPDVTYGAVLHLRPDHYELRPVRIDEEDVFATFRSLIHVTEWVQEIHKTVLGAPLTKEA